MNKFQYWIWAVIIASPSFLMAQPPEEELSPTAPEFNIEVMDAPTPAPEPAPATTNAQIQPILPVGPAKAPIVEPKKLETPAEDKSVKGITLSPSLMIKPFGFLNAEDANGSKYTYFELHPKIGLDSTFKTAQNRNVDLSVSYELTWDEFYTRRDVTKRYFEHEVDGDASMDWTKSFSTSFSTVFDYSLYASTEREYTIFSDSSVLGNFKINDQVTISTGYRGWFFNLSDNTFLLSDGTLPSDPSEAIQGNAVSGGSSPFSNDPFGNNTTVNPVVGNTWFLNNGVKLITTYVPMKGTKLKLDYEYVFGTLTNDPNQEWTGHRIAASIGQSMPWKGGKVTLKDDIRLRDYISKVNGDGSGAHNMRNRLAFVFNQEITDSLSAEFYYRLWMLGSNADNYDKLTLENEAYLGFTFKF